MPTDTVPARVTPIILDRSDESTVAALYLAAVGPVNSAYYLPVFMGFEAPNRPGASWNWAAALSTLSWMVFRRLWRAAIGYLLALALLVFLVVGVGRMVFQWSDGSEWAALAVLAVLACLIPGIYGNAWLQQDCRQRMVAALATTGSLEEACKLLRQHGSSRPRLIWLALANAALAGAAVGLLIAFPQTRIAARADRVSGEVGETSAPVGAGSAAGATPGASDAASAPMAPASETAVVTAPQEAASESSAALPSMPATSAAPDAATAAAAPDAALAPAAPAASAPRTARTRASQARTIAPGESAKAAPKRYYINVGLFAVAANATSAHARLKGAGLPVFTQPVDSAKGKLSRVRVGPFATQAEADAAAVKIRALKLEALVFRQ